ncbi:hypothetical protein GGX14DRAFT_404195 [Mycena pura]|uniref:HNH nuclease domain-containing protein n=1 Tax=Mycena pura TaxID=153505 RepID=A0AAD6UUM7_9AGAR|nr:hypothetical protein GGX14DRAFT_404195 [Mycena pura]
MSPEYFDRLRTLNFRAEKPTLKTSCKDRGMTFKEAFTFSQAHQVNLYSPLNIPKLPRSKHIDIVKNALVLRGDVHSQFDAYQFAFEPSMNHQTHQFNIPRLRLFERDGAPSISRQQPYRLQPAQSNATPDVNPLLLTQHFLTALLWHVAGNGLKANDNAIIPAFNIAQRDSKREEVSMQPTMIKTIVREHWFSIRLVGHTITVIALSEIEIMGFHCAGEGTKYILNSQSIKLKTNQSSDKDGANPL